MNIFKHLIFGIYGVIWYLLNYYTITNYFKTKNIIKHKIKNFHLWKPNAHYFSGYNKENQRKVFIKFSSSYYIKREIEAIKLLLETGSDISWVPKIIDSTITSSIPNIIFQYIEGMPLNRFLKEERNINKDFLFMLSNSLEKIIMELHGRGLIHRDIRPHNIILGENDIIYLIDFAYSIDVKNNNRYLAELPLSSKNHKILLRLGNGYNYTSGFWDDAFSCHKILSDLGAGKAIKSKFNNYVGKITWEISSC